MQKRRALIGPLGPALVPEASRWQASLAAEFGLSHDDAYRLDLCVEELVTNVVKYAPAECADLRVEMRVEIEGNLLRLTFVDPCPGFDPFARPAPAKAHSIEEAVVGGLGIQLMREFSDAHRYQRLDDRNVVELVFKLTPADGDDRPASPQARGADRRTNGAQPSFPMVLGDTRIETDRRHARDRRAMGFISSIQLLRGVPHSAIEDVLAPMAIVDVFGGVTLLKPGDANDTVFVVLDGGVQVFLEQPSSGDPIEIGVGECFGEMSVIDHRPVSSYVVGGERCRLLAIDADTFVERIMIIPGVARDLMSELFARTRRNDQRAIERAHQLMRLEQARRELQYARSIQESLLPKEPLFRDQAKLDCVGRLRTAREMGGDFYDLCALDARHVFFVVADVCGKSLPAALFMVRAVSALRAHSQFDGRPERYCSELVADLNEQLCTFNDAQQFLTAFCGVLDLQSGIIRYVNAGHNPPVLAIGTGDFRYLSEPINPFVGMVPGLSYRSGEVRLEPGSALVIYTDGVTEAEDARGGQLGEDRLLARLGTSADRTAGRLVDTVFDEVNEFAAGAEQSDDITVLAIRWPGG
jgi:sigma-B regulation protein RsbU (phosphoserine phosphatase)